MHENQKGFSAIEAVIILVIAAVISLVGWYAFIRDKDDKISKPTDTSKQTGGALDGQKKTFGLLGGKLTLADDGTWKTATGGNLSKESGRCGQDVGADTTCQDFAMFVPAGETFTNPDQFHVDVGVLASKHLTPKAWLEAYANPGGTQPKTSDTTINGLKAYRYEVDYAANGGDEIRLAYVIATGDDTVVLVTTSLFNGDHYSYKGTQNYRTMLADVDAFVQSLKQK